MGILSLLDVRRGLGLISNYDVLLVVFVIVMGLPTIISTKVTPKTAPDRRTPVHILANLAKVPITSLVLKILIFLSQ
jgi:hypothetical protein